VERTKLWTEVADAGIGWRGRTVTGDWPASAALLPRMSVWMLASVRKRLSQRFGVCRFADTQDRKLRNGIALARQMYPGLSFLLGEAVTTPRESYRAWANVRLC